MFVQNMTFQVLYVLVRQLTPVQGLDLILHDVTVLFDVVLLVELLSKGNDVLPRHVGVGIKLGSGRSIGSLNVVLDEVSFLPQVHTGIKFLDIGDRDFLVDGHQTFHYLSSNFTACDLVINVEVFRDRHHHDLRTFFAGRFISLANAIH